MERQILLLGDPRLYETPENVDNKSFVMKKSRILGGSYVSGKKEKHINV